MPSGVFKTADGWLQFLVVRNDHWVKLCNVVLQMPDLATDPRFVNEEARMSNEAALMAIVRTAIAERPTAHWAGLLREADIMHERLNTFREFLRQPQADAINLISWLDIAGAPEPVPVPNVAGIAPLAPGTPRAATPLLGQHTSEVLREHGYSVADVAALIERKAVSQA
jgi:crotonobetainyl-CoA:carnitine CoA-transferase CaiB-like acyl-CoA transferase